MEVRALIRVAFSGELKLSRGDPRARVVRGAHEAEAHALAAQPQDAAPAGAGRRRELDPPQRLRDLQQEGERVLGDGGLEAQCVCVCGIPALGG